jgi:hypothetical protein
MNAILAAVVRTIVGHFACTDRAGACAVNIALFRRFLW